MPIRFVEVSKRYQRSMVVDRLNLEIRDGEMMVLLGPSGCGKTTTLRMLAGLEPISQGEIYIGSRCVNDVPPRDRDLAMVFQNYALYPHMTVYGNIAYPLKIRGDKPDRIREQVTRVAGMLEIEGLLERRPRELSGGERQRVSLARAVIRRPSAFLMDEPLSNLDARLRMNMRGELKHLQRELRITTLYVTHDQAEAMTLAHRVAVMNKGKLQQVGTPMDLYLRPANIFVAGFLGSPPMNFVHGGLSDGRFAFEGGTLGLSASALNASAGKPLVMGFRPESATLGSPEVEGAWRAEVYVTEQMGSELFVYLKSGTQLFGVRAGADFQAEIGDIFGIQVAPDSTHLFDSETGLTISTVSTAIARSKGEG